MAKVIKRKLQFNKTYMKVCVLKINISSTLKKGSGKRDLYVKSNNINISVHTVQPHMYIHLNLI